ncbi:hypothetical protein DBR32_00625 [Taibaiella sp. KBW10]|uniref:hypothetical protein n=1 Tax=Taibaiella sp. KBW10 TaxID=2153357 RepID=UPI000F5A06E6|nr:hypothetical protein [Taibaiella sp. KBW10]RQO32151.1 hypothetical protein DBR32_00625 [Taibaiella sp. KBW10]
MKKVYYPALIALMLGGISCDRMAPKRDAVWVPTYQSKAEATVIKALPAKALITAGKIYAWGNYVFQLEPNAGIHVYQMENKTPQPYKFIQVYGAQEISIKDGNLYTNNYSDMVSLDLSNFDQITVKARIPKAFSIGQDNLPPERGYFQCVDTTKGIVTGWKKESNIEATCKY